MTEISASKTGGIVVAEVEMTATSFGGHFLLVEGEDDSRFWKTRIDKAHCQLIIAGDKDNVIEASRLLDKKRFANAFGVVDQDFDWVDDAHHSPRVAITDSHDIETMMADSQAFDKVLAEHGSIEKITAFEHAEGITVLDALIKRALPFGRLRWYNHQEHLGVCFDDLRPYRFVDKETWALDESALGKEFSKQATAKHSAFNPGQFTQWLSSAEGDPWLIIQGHDLLCILAQGLKKVLGSAQLGERDLAKAFRLAYEQAFFEKTALCGFVRRWEQANQIAVFSVAV